MKQEDKHPWFELPVDPPVAGAFSADASFESPQDPLTSPGAPEEAPPPRRQLAIELAVIIGIAILLAVVLRTFVTQTYAISGDSMNPTLEDGEWVMINKLSKDSPDLQRGDMVIFQSPRKSHGGKDLIKRVVALPGDEVHLDSDGKLYVNGTQVDESYIVHDPRRRRRRIIEEVISPGHVFVLGDNRPESQDSRSFGEVPIANIHGEVFVRLWPLESLEFFD